MERQITDEDRIMVDRCLNMIVRELAKRTDNILQNPNAENINKFNTDLFAYRQMRILADRNNVDAQKYDTQVNSNVLLIKIRGIIAI